MSTLVTSWEQFLEEVANPNAEIVFADNMVIDANDTNIPLNEQWNASSIDFNGCILKNLVVPSDSTFAIIENNLFGPGHKVVKNLNIVNCILGDGSILLDSEDGHNAATTFIDDCMFYVTGENYTIVKAETTNITYSRTYCNRCGFSIHLNLIQRTARQKDIFYGCQFYDCTFMFVNHQSPIIETYGTADYTPLLFNGTNNGGGSYCDHCYFTAKNGCWGLGSKGIYFGSGSKHNFFNAEIRSGTLNFVFSSNTDKGPLIINSGIISEDAEVQILNNSPDVWGHMLTPAQLKDIDTVLATGFDIWPETAR